jgi:outer membrane protein OmpA-like peptidoglycan-associated protein
MPDNFCVFFGFMRRIQLLHLCFLLLSLPAIAQVQPRAQSHFDAAMRYRAKRENDKAIAEMQQAINADGSYTEAYSALGEWLFQARRYSEAIPVLQRASTSIRNGNIAFAKPLAKCYLYNYQPSEALSVLNSTTPAKANAEWQQMKAQCIFMQEALHTPVADSIHNMGIAVNTRYAETHPYISADSQTLFFTRRMNGIDEDFYHSRVDSCGGWFYARNMGSPPNTSSHETAQMISPDGHYVFFGRSDARSELGWERGGSDLYMAYTADSIWSVPQSFGGTINTPAYEGMPCLSADNRELFFVSNRPDGYGGMDIWVSRFENGLWQLPRNLGPEVNTSGDETAPFLHTDNNTLYFTSTGHVGLGGSDLFYCRRTGDTTWTKPRNLGYPINSSADENGMSITVDGRTGYLSSDRDSVVGNFDIYTFKMPKELQPVPVAIVKGHTYDSTDQDKERLNYSSIYISDAQTGEQVFHFTSNRGDGSYMITLPVGKDYVYSADRIGYLETHDTIRLKHVDTMVSMTLNMPLLPQSYIAPVSDSTALTIYFMKNSAQMSDSTRNILRYTLNAWRDKPNVLVMVNGYTDNTGTPMINETLSYERAGIVAREIMDMGWNEENVKPMGWGEADPIASNDDEEGRTLNRRVEVIIRY